MNLKNLLYQRTAALSQRVGTGTALEDARPVEISLYSNLQRLHNTDLRRPVRIVCSNSKQASYTTK